MERDEKRPAGAKVDIHNSKSLFFFMTECAPCCVKHNSPMGMSQRSWMRAQFVYDASSLSTVGAYSLLHVRSSIISEVYKEIRHLRLFHHSSIPIQ
jgi:hypothetical protein